jgi:hypothetical protein
MVEFGKAPIDEAKLQCNERRRSGRGVSAYLPFFGIAHDVVWLHVTVHDSFGMAEIESLVTIVRCGM